MILFNKKHWLRKIILGIVGLVVLIVVINVTAGGGAKQPTGATAAPATGSAAKGCHDLAAWEKNTYSGNSVQIDTNLQNKIAADARGTKFAADFAAWATSSDPVALSNQITADCRPYYADVINAGG